MEIISSKQEEEFKATTFVVNIVKLHSNPKVLFKRLYVEFRNFDSERFRHTIFFLFVLYLHVSTFKRHLFSPQNPMYNCGVISVES